MRDPILPFAALCHAQCAAVEHVDNRHHGVFDFRFYIARGDVGAAFKGFFDNNLQVLHDAFLWWW